MMKRHTYYVARRLKGKMGEAESKEFWRNLLRGPTSSGPTYSLLICRFFLWPVFSF